MTESLEGSTRIQCHGDVKHFRLSRAKRFNIVNRFQFDPSIFTWFKINK